MDGFVIRKAERGDERGIFELIRALAEYEKLADRVTGSAENLGEHLFGARPACEALVAKRDGAMVGYALFFGSYSTFLTAPGVYLEDLFVLPNERRRGIGAALLSAVAKIALERGAARLEWSVLDWNTPALAFYEKLGAEKLDDWTVHRVFGDTLRALAALR
jgi:GNAT superfamily N-acetyltransferase